MSGAELTRRAWLAAGSALVLAPPLFARTGREFRAFKGIRYAAAKRFEAPVALLDNRTALGGFGPACPQRGDRYQPQSEDCLFLNVWTTEDRKSIVSGKSVAVRLDLGGRRYLQNTTL